MAEAQPSLAEEQAFRLQLVTQPLLRDGGEGLETLLGRTPLLVVVDGAGVVRRYAELLDRLRARDDVRLVLSDADHLGTADVAGLVDVGWTWQTLEAAGVRPPRFHASFLTYRRADDEHQLLADLLMALPAPRSGPALELVRAAGSSRHRLLLSLSALSSRQEAAWASIPSSTSGDLGSEDLPVEAPLTDDAIESFIERLEALGPDAKLALVHDEMATSEDRLVVLSSFRETLAYLGGGDESSEQAPTLVTEATSLVDRRHATGRVVLATDAVVTELVLDDVGRQLWLDVPPTRAAITRRSRAVRPGADIEILIPVPASPVLPGEDRAALEQILEAHLRLAR